MAPPTALAWPSMYLVVEWVTMSAPHSKGWQFTGVAKVLSTMRGTPWAWGRPGELLKVQHGEGGVGDGLAKDGPGLRPEGGLQLGLGAVGVDRR